MAFTFSIAAVAKTLQPGWRISEVLNGRNVMEFAVQSLDGTYRPAARAVVAFTEGFTTLFAGKIHNQGEAGLGGYGVTPIETRCGATDYNVYADERLFELTILAGTTLKAGLTQIVEVLAGKGVTLSASQANGITFDEDFVLELGTGSSHLDKLSVVTGWAWDISYTKVLSMAGPGNLPDGTAWNAPFNIAAGDGNTIGDIQVEPSLADFANVVTVRYSSAATTAYAFFDKASGTFSNGETLTVGGKTYTLQTTLTDVDGNVFIGASNLITLENIHRAITLGAGVGTSYATSMTLNSQVTAGMQSESSIKVVALQAGAGGNSIACTETCVGASWKTEGGGGTITLLFGADESLSLWVTAPEDPAEMPPAVDRVDLFIDHPDVRDQATAQLLADGYLVRALAAPDTIKYRTNTSGLHPGMRQDIVEAKRNLNATCLIVAVEITATGNLLHYDITAVEALVIPPDELEIFSDWSRGGGNGASSGISITTITIGANGQINSGATSWTLGTGFWLDYNAGSPRFRIGTVAGNRLSYDANGVVTIVSAALTIDANGVLITPSTAYTEATAFRFGTEFGLYGYAISTTFQQLLLQSKRSGGDVKVTLLASDTTDQASLLLRANAGFSYATLTADVIALSGTVGLGATSVTSLTVGSLVFPTSATSGYIPFPTSANVMGESVNIQFDGNNFILGTSVGATAQLTAGTANAVGYDLRFRKARGTYASPTVITTGDELGEVHAYGYGGAAGYIEAASIRLMSSGTIADSRVPGEIQFWTGTNAAPSVLTQRVTIDNAGLTTFSGAVLHSVAVTDAGATLRTGVISPTQLVANTDNWNPTGLATANVIRINVDAARNITGLVAQASGTMLLLYNTTAFTVSLMHDVTSTAANCFYCAGAVDFPLTQKKSVWIRYDGTHSRWTVIGA